MFYVYILEFINDRSWYIGYTGQQLKARVGQHQRGEVTSTCHRGAFKLMYFEGYGNKQDALGRERFLKSGAGRRFLKKQLRHYLRGNN